MNIALYRSSGQPLNPDHIEPYYKELNDRMDDLEKVSGKCTSENAERYQEYMAEIHTMITSKYPNKGTIEYPTTVRQAAKLCKKYGALAYCVEDGKLVAYIMDA